MCLFIYIYVVYTDTHVYTEPQKQNAYLFENSPNNETDT